MSGDKNNDSNNGEIIVLCGWKSERQCDVEAAVGELYV